MKKKLFGGIVALIMALVNTLRALTALCGKRERFAYVVTRRLCNEFGEDSTEFAVFVFRTEKGAMAYMRKNYAAYTYEDLREFHENLLCRWENPESPEEEYLYEYELYKLYKVPVK